MEISYYNVIRNKEKYSTKCIVILELEKTSTTQFLYLNVKTDQSVHNLCETYCYTKTLH